MSVKQTGVTIGGTLAGITLPPLAILTSWRVALLAVAVVALSVGCWGFAKRESAVREPLVLADRTISVRRSRLAFYAFWMAGIQLAILGYTAVYLVDHQGFSPQRAGLALSLALAAGTVGRLVWGAVSDWSRDRIRILQLAAGGSALVLLFMPLATTALIWPLVVVAGFCSVGWNGMFLTVTAESAGPGGVGRASSFILPFFYAGSICLPPLLGLVVEHASWTWFWLIGAGGSALAGLVLANAVLADARAPGLQPEVS
jgi:predicted MFS family arabinose efflux permease